MGKAAVIDEALAEAFTGREVQIWPEPFTFLCKGFDGAWHLLENDHEVWGRAALTTPIYELKGN